MPITLCALTVASGGDTPTSPTPTTETSTIADPSIAEELRGTLAVGGFSFYSFAGERRCLAGV